MEVILKSIRKDKVKKRRKLMELERLINSGGDKNEIEKLRWEVSGKRNDSFDEELFEGRTKENIEEEKKIAAENAKLNPTRTRVAKFRGVWKEWKEKAESNGIDYDQFMQRIRRDWTCEEAAGKVVRQRRTPLWEKYRERCEKNGVSYKLFVQRLNKGWSEEKASSKYDRSSDVVNWDEWKDICKGNGVTYNAFYSRCKKGWNNMKAATTPLIDNGKK